MFPKYVRVRQAVGGDYRWAGERVEGGESRQMGRLQARTRMSDTYQLGKGDEDTSLRFEKQRKPARRLLRKTRRKVINKFSRIFLR